MALRDQDVFSGNLEKFIWADFALTGIHVHGAGVDLLLDSIVPGSFKLVAVLQARQSPVSNCAKQQQLEEEEEEEEQDEEQQSQ